MIENSVIFISAYIIALVCNNIFFVLFLFSHKMKLLPFSESIIFWLFLHLIFGNNLCGWESFSSLDENSSTILSLDENFQKNFWTFSSISLSLDENSSSSVTKVGEWSRFLWICKKSRIFVHISINQKNQKKHNLCGWSFQVTSESPSSYSFFSDFSF